MLNNANIMMTDSKAIIYFLYVPFNVISIVQNVPEYLNATHTDALYLPHVIAVSDQANSSLILYW